MEQSSLIGNTNQSSKVFVLMAIAFMFILNEKFSFIARAYAESEVHIVYLGKTQHDDPEVVTDSHHRMLESILGSKEAAHKSLVYSYRHGFSGFAAKLTDSQVKKISELPEVIHVIPNGIYTLHTTRTFDFLSLSPSSPKGLPQDSNMGHDIIIGVIDSGIWPESESFNDKGLGPIPKRWKGQCVSGEQFNATMHCNRKIIGARYYINGIREKGVQINGEYISPRDSYGHGTHVASTAAGSFVPNISYYGLAEGIARGGAPQARIAVYKVCWSSSSSACSIADVWKAFDDAINDGVDVLSVSLGPSVPLLPEVDEKNDIVLGAFHAVTKGIPVVCSAGNGGPLAQTVVNVAPWILTVAATTMDRTFLTTITLGNNQTILGQSAYQRQEVGFTRLVLPAGDSEDPSATMEGNVVLAFDTKDISMGTAYGQAFGGGAVGTIVAGSDNDMVDTDDMVDTEMLPSVYVDYEQGTKILWYIRSTSSPTVKISPSRTITGQIVATKVAGFSSRGPNSISPAILKPDIAAPGGSILAALPMKNNSRHEGFGFMSGTSMATPAVAGIVALIKVLHPDWSPAAIRSAIVTTALKTDPYGEPIFAEGSSRKLADPFDYGGGLVNPEKAAKPGLVYDMGMDDYVHYLCSAGYKDSAISKLAEKATTCPSPKPSILDFNLPSITIPSLKEEVTLTRTVTNVGPVNSVYKAVIDPPLGINVAVKPETLVFNPGTKKITFSVTVSTTHKANTGYYFGSLTWTDGTHNVTIPLSVRTQTLMYN